MHGGECSTQTHMPEIGWQKHPFVMRPAGSNGTVHESRLMKLVIVPCLGHCILPHDKSAK